MNNKPPPFSFGDLRSAVVLMGPSLGLSPDWYVMLSLGLRFNPWGLDESGLTYLASYLHRGRAFLDHLDLWRQALDCDNGLFPTPFWSENRGQNYWWRDDYGKPRYLPHTSRAQDLLLRPLLAPVLQHLRYDETLHNLPSHPLYPRAYLFLIQWELSFQISGGWLSERQRVFLEGLESDVLQEAPLPEDPVAVVEAFLDLQGRTPSATNYWEAMAPCFEEGAWMAVLTWQNLLDLCGAPL
jgi:hypothetical protein